MKKWFMAMALLFCVSAVNAQAEYPDVPMGDPAYADLTIVAPVSGIFDCCFSTPCPSGPRIMTRYEFAVAVARVIANLTITNQRTYPIAFKESQLSVTSQQGAALQRLSKEFQPEIQSLGIPSFIIEERQVANTAKNPQQWETQFFVRPIVIAPPFSDVPKNHWAFFALEKLRQDGVLIGSPDGASIKTAK